MTPTERFSKNEYWQVLERRTQKGEYHPSNPKIDVYMNGEYVASTNFYRTCKEYLAGFRPGDIKHLSIKAVYAKN